MTERVRHDCLARMKRNVSFPPTDEAAFPSDLERRKELYITDARTWSVRHRGSSDIPDRTLSISQIRRDQCHRRMPRFVFTHVRTCIDYHLLSWSINRNWLENITE